MIIVSWTLYIRVFRIILVHSRDAVLHSMSPQFHSIALDALKKLDVEIILNDRVAKGESSTVCTFFLFSVLHTLRSAILHKQYVARCG